MMMIGIGIPIIQRIIERIRRSFQIAWLNGGESGALLVTPITLPFRGDCSGVPPAVGAQ